MLKAAVRDLLPPEILTTRKKGFSIPMNDWMRRGILAWGLPLLRDGVLVQRGAIDPSTLDRYVERHAPKRTWLLLAAELWARRWLEREDVEALAKSLPRG